MEVPRLGVQMELQLLAYTTATVISVPSRVFNLHHSSWQLRILNLLSEARDRTQNLLVPNQIRFAAPQLELHKTFKSRFIAFQICARVLTAQFTFILHVGATPHVPSLLKWTISYHPLNLLKD